MIGKAIFGGSFDPVHFGHLAMAKAGYLQLPVNEVIFMPTKLRYYKKASRMSEDTDRLNMLRLAAGTCPYLTVSDYELNQPEEMNYTVNTLETIHREHPEWELFFILGGDSLAYLDTWREAERLFQMAVFAPVVRDEVGLDEVHRLCESYRERFPGSRFHPLKIEPVNISSTEIRRRMAEGKSLGGLVPDAVEAYIRERNLYHLAVSETS